MDENIEKFLDQYCTQLLSIFLFTDLLRSNFPRNATGNNRQSLNEVDSTCVSTAI